MSAGTAMRHGRAGRLDMARGSVVLFALFACLGVAVCIQALSVAVLCSERALADEVGGRQRLASMDAVLATLRTKAAGEWLPVDWKPQVHGAYVMHGRLVESEEDADWVLQAEVADSVDGPGQVVSAVVERGRDGVDLPKAACVASRVRVATGRQTDWLLADDCADTGEPVTPVAWLRHPESAPIMSSGYVVMGLSREWGLGEGWVEALADGEIAGSSVMVLPGVVGQTVRLAAGVPPCGQDRPLLVVVTGGADLDLRNLGDVWGVFLVDGGSVLLEGSTIHGAVFAGEAVDLGLAGQILFDARILRWATQASLERVRLVRGTRCEATR